MVVYDRTVVYNIHYHIVWVTKYRKPVFHTAHYKESALEILTDLADKHDAILEEVNIQDEHIHILMSMKPKYSLSTMMQKLKGGFARTWFTRFPETRKKLWGGHLWTPSYYVGTLGDVSIEVVEEYIKNQEQKNS